MYLPFSGTDRIAPAYRVYFIPNKVNFQDVTDKLTKIWHAFFREISVWGVRPIVAAQSACTGEFGVIPLAEHLVHADGNAVRKVQAACFGKHGDAYTPLAVLKEQIFREAGGLFSEKEVAVIRISDIRVLMNGFCREEEKFSAVLFEKLVERVVIGDVQKGPVIETGTL